LIVLHSFDIEIEKRWICLDKCAYRDYSVDTKKRYVEILNFRHFHRHIVFIDEGQKMRNKEIKDYINVSVLVDIKCGHTRE